jgi:hypothetical protein
MNRHVVLFHLKEAAEELDRIIQEIAENPKFSEVEFGIAMGHAYHHLNTAWNGRNQTTNSFGLALMTILTDFGDSRRKPSSYTWTADTAN